MKQILIITALLISMTAFSQKKGFLSSSFGLGIPMSDYKWNANAKIGFGYGIEGGYYFTKGIGVGAKISTITNSVDEYFLLYDFKQELSGIDHNYISVNATEWTLLNLAIGIYGKIPIGKHFEFEGKTLFGFLITQSPKYEFEFESDYGDFNFVEYPANSSVFQYNGELTFKYLIGESSSINIFGSLTGANPTFNVDVESTIDGVRERDYDIYSQNILLINTGIGFTYRF